MKVYIGSDHAGIALKEKIKIFLSKKDIYFEDLGSYGKENDDYPDYAKIVSKKVIANKNSKGILICGSGSGMVIAANRIKKIRASLIYDDYSAKMSRMDNNSNIACLRARNFNYDKSIRLVWLWLNTSFSKQARHQRRIKKLDEIE